MTTWHYLRSLFLTMLLSFVVFQSKSQNEIDNLRNLLSSSEGNQRIDALNSLASYLLTIDPIESERLLVESLDLAQASSYSIGQVEGMLVFATYFSKQNQLSKTDSTLSAAISLANEIDYQRGLARAQLTLGVLKMRQGRFAESIEHHFEGIDAARRLEDKDLELNHTMNIGLINQQMGNLEESDKYLNMALQIAKTNDLRFRTAQVYLNLAVLEYHKQNLGKSIEFNMEALTLFRAEEDKSNAARALNNLGFAYNILGETDKAMNYYDQSIALKEQLGDYLGTAVTLLNQAMIMKKANSFERALALANKALEMGSDISSLRVVMDAEKFLYEFYEGRSNYRDAYKHYQAFSIAKDSFNILANRTRVEELTSQFELTQLQNENKLRSQQNELQELKIAQRNQIILIISVFFLVIVIWFLWNRSALKNKLRLSQKDQMIISKDAELRIKQSNLEKEKLLQYTDHLLAKNQVLEERRLKLVEQETINSKDKNEIDQMVDRLRNSIVNDKDWAAFRLYFDAVYPDYFQSLKKQKGVDLTLSEQRMASLLKIRLTSKEIADILGISPDSVLKSKTRLRQKLQFETVKSLDSFLTTL